MGPGKDLSIIFHLSKLGYRSYSMLHAYLINELHQTSEEFKARADLLQLLLQMLLQNLNGNIRRFRNGYFCRGQDVRL